MNWIEVNNKLKVLMNNQSEQDSLQTFHEPQKFKIFEDGMIVLKSNPFLAAACLNFLNLCLEYENYMEIKQAFIEYFELMKNNQKIKNELNCLCQDILTISFEDYQEMFCEIFQGFCKFHDQIDKKLFFNRNFDFEILFDVFGRCLCLYFNMTEQRLSFGLKFECLKDQIQNSIHDHDKILEYIVLQLELNLKLIHFEDVPIIKQIGQTKNQNDFAIIKYQNYNIIIQLNEQNLYQQQDQIDPQCLNELQQCVYLFNKKQSMKGKIDLRKLNQYLILQNEKLKIAIIKRNIKYDQLVSCLVAIMFTNLKFETAQKLLEIEQQQEKVDCQYIIKSCSSYLENSKVMLDFADFLLDSVQLDITENYFDQVDNRLIWVDQILSSQLKGQSKKNMWIMILVNKLQDLKFKIYYNAYKHHDDKFVQNQNLILNLQKKNAQLQIENYNLIQMLNLYINGQKEQNINFTLIEYSNENNQISSQQETDDSFEKI